MPRGVLSISSTKRYHLSPQNPKWSVPNASSFLLPQSTLCATVHFKNRHFFTFWRISQHWSTPVDQNFFCLKVDFLSFLTHFLPCIYLKNSLRYIISNLGRFRGYGSKFRHQHLFSSKMGYFVKIHKTLKIRFSQKSFYTHIMMCHGFINAFWVWK